MQDVCLRFQFCAAGGAEYVCNATAQSWDTVLNGRPVRLTYVRANPTYAQIRSGGINSIRLRSEKKFRKSYLPYVASAAVNLDNAMFVGRLRHRETDAPLSRTTSRVIIGFKLDAQTEGFDRGTVIRVRVTPGMAEVVGWMKFIAFRLSLSRFVREMSSAIVTRTQKYLGVAGWASIATPRRRFRRTYNLPGSTFLGVIHLSARSNRAR